MILQKLYMIGRNGSEIKMYATYKVVLYNDSDTLDVTINQFSDYYDSTFTLVKEDVKADVLDSEGVKYSKIVAEQPYYRIYSLLNSDVAGIYKYSNEKDFSDTVKEKLKRSSNNERKVVYGKVPKDSWKDKETDSDAYKRVILNDFKYETTEDKKKVKESDFILSPGERLELFLTYEIDQEGYKKAIDEEYLSEKLDETREKLLGGKNNVVEIDNYSSFYTKEGIRFNTTAYRVKEIAGRIDTDSAPGNINLSKTIKDEDDDETLDKKWFEDDTDSAPVYRIYLRKEDSMRKIDGQSWLDEKGKEIKNSSGKILDTATGNGKLDDDEKGINDITVSLVEKIRISRDNSDSSKDVLEYEFIWPEEIKNIMKGYEPITKTKTEEDKDGIYNFTNFPAGIYAVRFEYGDTKETIKYNGQDYENTAYQIDLKNAEEYPEKLIQNCDTEYQKDESTLNNEWHDIGDNETAENLEKERVSDARDYEPQRLRVLAYSRTISNSNGEVLASLETKKTDYEKELIDATAMVANTAKLNIQVERTKEINYTDYNEDKKLIRVIKGVSKKEIEGTEDITTKEQEYNVKNIDFGIEKRAQTSIQLDKYLKKIVLTKQNTSDVILEANINDDETIEYDADSSLNISKILAMTQSEGVQGFKYITMESSYFNDLQVLLTYRIDVINESEVDWTSEKLSKIYNDEKLLSLADEIEGDYSTNKNKHTPLVTGEGISYGENLGYYYYTNESIDGEEKDASKPIKEDADFKYKDEVVKTTVDQLVDYIDKDTSLASSSKALHKNDSWRDNLNKEKNTKEDGTEETENVYKSGKVKTLDGLISDDSYSEIAGELYLADNNENPFISETKSNIAISTSDVIEKKERKLVKYGSRNIDKNGKRISEPSEAKRENTYRYIEPEKKPNNVHNPEITKELVPISYKKDGANKDSYEQQGSINVSTSISVNQSEAADDMNYNNVAEVLVYSNTVGRRTFMEDNKDTEKHESIKTDEETIPTIPGNAIEIIKLEDNGGFWNAGHSSNRSKAEDVKLAEMDADATEYVTFTEPTGLTHLSKTMNKHIFIILITVIVILMISVIGMTIRIVIHKRNGDM